IAASSGTELVRAAAASTRKVGEYQATLLFPHPGRWTIRINSFGDEDLSQWGLAEGPTLPQFTGIAPGDPIPHTLSQEVLGERLFIVKGCIMCHNGGAEGLRPLGPELSGKRFSLTYLKKVLADPQAVRSTVSEMPRLDLSKSEVAAL